jgi:hypothetical protein
MTTDPITEAREVPRYKWLTPDRCGIYQGTRFPVRVKAWTPREDPVLCESGWHGVEVRDLLAHLCSDVQVLWEVECRDPIVRGDDKFACASMRLVREVGRTDATMLRLLACDIAESVLGIFEAEYPRDMRPRECIEVARRFAVGEATDEERVAAWDAAGGAAWAAARTAARVAAWESYGQMLLARLEA